ncbi:ATPase inhibitor mai-2, mitochondrial-like isoform X6 [Lineus longissimus]|uniref:ATPase inhibitor mai-2, mitochondrial-like isoform X6 n=1 Tax=Lineus longissimus TaxID=88925 RepID=UPI00315CBDEE
MALARSTGRLISLLRQNTRMMAGGEWGAGEGKGGGKGGSIRDAGGSFGKMEAAREEEYFRKLQQSQLRGLRAHLEEEVKFHETEIVGHKEAIERHKKRIGQLHHEEKKHKKDDD